MSTRIQPTEGRVVWVYSNRWQGKRPGSIVRVIGIESIPSQDGNALFNARVAINVDLDPSVDPRGNAGGSVLSVICNLHDHDRAAPESECSGGEWTYATWMPYQQGQAAKTDDVSVTLKNRMDAIEDRLDRHADDLEARIKKGDNETGPALAELRQGLEKVRHELDNISRGLINAGATANAPMPAAMSG